MYLKRLEIQGFKSFANKTLLEYGPGVTCVVGPNGTGKTNVADSLRWVLGEHASRQIRARKTEDVIFAGSDKRAPMGVAEVSITLDNSGHWLPIDFNEVVVSRRAYRSGDNEYLINHARVRLRDVVELFQRAQVGQNSYAFMGQGMVEQALSLRAEDRRALIEEAADVRIYRVKLEDARNKLKATRENVERIRLLVREIEPRIGQLERQAGRAVRYEELTHELAETLHVWYRHQWREINDALLAAHTDEDQRAEDSQQARSEARACEEALTQLRAAIDERRREATVRGEGLRNKQDYVRDLERRVALDSERRRMLAERMQELVSEMAELQSELDASTEGAAILDTTAAEAQLAGLRSELTEHRARAASIEHELLTHQRDALQEEHRAARARAAAEESERRAGELSNEVARLRRDADAASEMRRAAIAGLAAWGREFARLSNESAVSVQSIADARRAKDATMARAEGAAAERESISAQVRELDTEVAASRIRLEYVERMDVEPLAPDAGVRMILEAGGVRKRETGVADVEIDGVRGLVGQLIRIPPGLERAIEAALAENLVGVVFDRELDLREAVRLLLDGERGRATMYALDSFIETRPLNLIKEKGVVGVASALVRCDARYRRLIDTLLGRVVVVENLTIAQRFVKRGLAHAVATIDGVLLRPVGSISAGSTAVVQAELAFRREAAEIPADVERIEAELAERRAAFERASAELDGYRQRIGELDANVSEQEERHMHTQASLAASRARRAALSSQLRAADAASSRRDAEIASRLAERQSMEAPREQLVRDAVTADEREESARRAIAELDSSRSRIVEQISELAARIAQAEGELRADRSLTGPDRQSRERLLAQITAKSEQHHRLEAEVAVIGARLQNDERELATQGAEADALQQEIEPARRELAQFESRERTLATELMDANGRMREAERANTDAQNSVRLLTDELGSLRVSLESEGFIVTPDGDVARAPEPERQPDAPVEAGDGGDYPPTWLKSDDDHGALPPIAGGSTIDAVEMRDRVADLRAQIRALGPVNAQASSDYTENKERYDFLTTQLRDLQEAETQLLDAVDDLEREIRERFRETFKVVNKEFERYFDAFFRGGSARLELGETDAEGLPGVEIFAQPPGKKLGSLALLSGGEKSLTAVALLFALLSANPSPICVLDEVDAALDEANVGRFVDELRALSARTQFIIITHNRRTIENADSIYGISMGADSVSRVLSLKLSDVKVED